MGKWVYILSNVVQNDTRHALVTYEMTIIISAFRFLLANQNSYRLDSMGHHARDGHIS
jgi:hypothetical protein